MIPTFALYRCCSQVSHADDEYDGNDEERADSELMPPVSNHTPKTSSRNHKVDK
jgi:hypothetical protein